MFIIPTSDVLLLGTAMTIVLAALQRFIGGAWFHIFVFKGRKVDLAA